MEILVLFMVRGGVPLIELFGEDDMRLRLRVPMRGRDLLILSE